MEEEINDEQLEGDADGKNPRLLLIILVLLALLEAGGIAYFYAESRNKTILNTTLRSKLTQSERSILEKSRNLDKQRERLERLNRDLDRITREKDSLKEGITSKEQLLAELEGRLKSKEKGEKTIKAQLERQSQIAAYLRKRLKESKNTELQLMERLENLLKKKATLESRMAQLRGAPSLDQTAFGGIPLEGVTVAGRAPGVRAIEGQILIANKKYGFVILNLGSADGIAVGDEGAVIQKGKKIATAKVKKLYNKMSLADISPISKDSVIEKNLTVEFARPPGNTGS